jgi:GTP-binding protein YchF
MSLKIAIVGLPNVGKSTLFNALMRRMQAQAANHPFTTIEPNVGIVDLPDERLQKLADIVHPEKIVPATVTFVDIAGIIKGASQGEGLGNQFLANIREADALAIVLRCFANDSIIHVAGQVNPLDDAQVVLLELILADLGTLQKRINALEADVRAKVKDSEPRLAYAKRLMAALEAEKAANTELPTSEPESQLLKELQLLTSKPILYVANVAEDEAGATPEQVIEKWNLASLFETSQPENQKTRKLIPISAQVESELTQLDEPEAAEYLQSLGLNQPGLNRLIRASFDLLGLSTYFTAGPMEVRAWTILRGYKAPQAAGVIHGDFEKGFIRAEVISYADYIALNGEAGAKTAGKLRSEGKEYIVADGDVIHFRFNV